MTKKKHPGGRPTVMTPDILSKLEHAFSMGCSDVEACLFAGISTTPLYAYQLKHPEFEKRKEELKQNPVMKARTTVFNDLSQPETAKWLLERKAKNEFGKAPEVGVVALEDLVAAINGKTEDKREPS